MDNLFKAAFKSQTVCGAIHFCLFLVSWPTVIALLNGFLDKDRLTFNCVPKPSDVTKQLCYDDYISTVSPVLIPLNFAYITCAAVGFLWIIFIVYSIKKMRQIKSEPNRQSKKRLSKKFTWRFLLHVCCQLVVLGVMMGLFCHYQTLSLPVVYMCSQRNTTQIPVNQEKNMTCSDMYYRQKSKLNIGIITIMAISIVLCGTAIIHLLLTRKEFLQELVGDPGGDDAEGINLEASAEGNSPVLSSSDREESEHITSEDISEETRSSSSRLKRGSPSTDTRDPKRIKLKDSAAIFLEWCQEQLREFYNTMSQVKITPWDPDNTVHIDDIYIQLSMLRDDRKPDRTTKERLHDYSDIFMGHGHHLYPKRILVYGRPGIGKSTFTQKIAVDWTRGEKEILKKFDVLLLIKLRDVCDIEDFCAMLKTAELLSAEDSMAVTNLYEYVCQNQEKVLLVLDGYDEYSAGKSSPVYQIWKGSKLRGCCVVITTRPVKEDELRGPSHVQFELNGFDSEEQVEQFASKLLSDQKDVEELVTYLRKRHLWSMAEIPLLLLMLCLLWKGKDRKGLPTSRADLYIRFMQTLLDHLAAKDSDETFKSLEEYKKELSKLGELAFYALLEDCLHFNFSKLPDGDVFKKFIDVGFFQISKLSSLSPEKIVYFLHKSVQEFLAAWFIVQELMIKKNETVTCLSKVDSLEKMKKMFEVLKHVCELSSDAARAVLSHLRIIGEKEGLTAYNFTKTPSIDDLSEDQRGFISISSDCLLCYPASDRQAVFPLYLECVNYVAVLNEEQIPIAAREHLLNSTSSFPNYVFFDCKFSGNGIVDDIFSIMLDLNTVVVSCSGKIRTVKKYADVLGRDFVLKKEGPQMFFYLTRIYKAGNGALPTELLTDLTSIPVSPPQQPVDDLSKNQDNSGALVLTENVPKQTRPHCLSFVREIEISYPATEDLMVVNNVLPFVRSPRNVYILFSAGVTPDDQSIESMVSNIQFTDNLQSLTHIGINLTAKCATDIARSLHQAPNLHKLDLSNNPLYSTSVSDLAENLHHVPRLTELRLCYANIGDKESERLVHSLKHVNKLQVLDLSWNPLGHGIIELAKHLNSVPDLNELELVDTQMGEEEATAVAHCLKSLPQLKLLELSSNPLGHGIIELAKHLCSVPRLTGLGLRDTQMGEEEVSALARALKYVPELEGLDLGSNPLGRGISVLSQHLSSILKLTLLDLRRVKMTKKEVEELCTAVRGTSISLATDYHTRDYETGGRRLRTEAELHTRNTLFADE